jgi:hypothetical protein
MEMDREVGEREDWVVACVKNLRKVEVRIVGMAGEVMRALVVMGVEELLDLLVEQEEVELKSLLDVKGRMEREWVWIRSNQSGNYLATRSLPRSVRRKRSFGKGIMVLGERCREIAERK